MAHYKPESKIEQLGTSINKELHQKVKTYCSNTGIQKRMVINDALLEYFAIQNYQQELRAYCIENDICINDAVCLAIKNLLKEDD